MTDKIVIDTSVIVDFTRGRSTHFKDVIKYSVSENVDLFIPTVVVVEIFVGREMLDRKKKNEVKKLIKGIKRVNLDSNLAMATAKLGRKVNFPFDIADLTIAATTLSLKAYLATHNVKHFKQIPKLKIFNFESTQS